MGITVAIGAVAVVVLLTAGFYVVEWLFGAESPKE